MNEEDYIIVDDSIFEEIFEQMEKDLEEKLKELED